MVHFVMDDCKNLQRPGDGQSSICVVIIIVCLLHVYVLEIIQLMCHIWLGTHRVCIPKALQRLAIRANLSPRLFVMYWLKFVFLIAFNFDNKIGSNPIFSPTAFTSYNMSFHFVPVGRTFSTTFSPVVSVRILCGIASARGTMMVASSQNIL